MSNDPKGEVEVRGKPYSDDGMLRWESEIHMYMDAVYNSTCNVTRMSSIGIKSKFIEVIALKDNNLSFPTSWQH